MSFPGRRGDGAGPRPGAALLLSAASAATGLIAVWGHRFPPMQDYPVWLYEAGLLAGGVGSNPAGARLVGYPVPNAANTALIAAMTPWLGPETAGRVFLTLMVLVLATGTLAVLRAFRSGPGAWPAFLLVPGAFFFAGLLNYVLGLGVLYWGIAYLARRTARKTASPVLLGALTVVIFFCHAAVLAAWFLVLAGFLLGRNRGNRLRLLLGQCPGLALCAWAAVAWVSPVSLAPPTPASITPGFWVRSRIVTAVHAAAPLQVFDSAIVGGGESTTLLSVLNAVAVVLIGILVLAGLRRIHRDRELWRWMRIPLAAWTLAVLVFPPYFAGVFSLGQRFLPPLILVGLANVPDRKLPRWSRAGIGAAVVALLALSGAGVYRAGRAMERTHVVMHSLDPGGRGDLVDTGLFDYSDMTWTPERRPVFNRVFLPRHLVLGRVLYYLKIAGGERAPIWGTGLLRAPPPPVPFQASVRGLLSQDAADRLWLVGPEESRRKVAAALASRFRVSKERNPVTLLVAGRDP